MSTNVDEFKKAVDDYVRQEVPALSIAFQKKLAIEALKRVIEKTPVDTGFHRAQWQVSIGVPLDSILNRTDRQGNQTLAAGITKLAGMQAFQVVWITNNGPAIVLLEEGGFEPSDPGPSKDRRKSRQGRVLVKGGFSVQAPQGMVAVTIQELEVIFP